jgi:hypothetical protein
VEKLGWERVLEFDSVVFGTSETALRHAALVNPSGHAPISFAVLSDKEPGAMASWVARGVYLLQPWERPASSPRLGAPKGDRPATVHAISRLGTCPNKDPKKLVLMLHLGRHDPLRLDKVLQATANHTKDLHIWVTYTTAHSRPKLFQLSRDKPDSFFPLMIRNHGLDVGAFFLLLWQVARCGYQYSYIMKYHFKTDEQHFLSRQASLYFRQAGFLTRAMDHLDQHPESSAVCPHTPSEKPLILPHTHEHFLGVKGCDRPQVEDIKTLLPVPVAEIFLAGNVWLTRASIITRWLNETTQLWQLYEQLHGPYHVDWRWYNQFVLDNKPCSPSVARWHYYLNGRKENKPPNAYSPIPGFNPMYRDCMLEHGWERVLSFMMSHHGPFVQLQI